MTVLILGGTIQARELASLLHESGVPCVSSLAGRVKNPRLPVGECRIGGFGGAHGLATFLRERHIRAVVDATHPFAAQISSNAVAAAKDTCVPLAVLRRPGWTQQSGDLWIRVADAAGAVSVLREQFSGRRVFLSTGRQTLGAYLDLPAASMVARCVDPPDVDLPPNAELLLDRGPYSVDSELLLLESRAIDVLVTKDSGGDYTYAKIVAARNLSLPVVMINRPALAQGFRGPLFDSSVATVDWVLKGSERR